MSATKDPGKVSGILADVEADAGDLLPTLNPHIGLVRVGMLSGYGVGVARRPPKLYKSYKFYRHAASHVRFTLSF